MRIRSTFTFALLALAFAFTSTASAGPTADVIGGTDVTHEQYTSTYPFTVGLMAAQTPNAQFCGGTLIEARWVMTAAHCYAPEEGANPAFIRIGTEDRLGVGEYVPVVGHAIHPNWDPDYLSNDIMLMRLAYAPSPATPAVRATAIDDPLTGNLATLIGWGLTMPGDDAFSSRILKLATLDVIDQTECEDLWADLEGVDFVTNKQLCAIHYDEGDGARQACNGDSGGPLSFAGKVVGVVSFGYVGCFDEAPNVFTRVSAYNAWIDSVRQKLLTQLTESEDFGAIDTTAGSADRTITFRSDGDSAVSVLGASSSGDFAIKSNSCAGAIEPQASCSVVVTFDPTLDGPRFGELVLSTDSLGIPTKRVHLQGVGTTQPALPAAGMRLSIPRKSTIRKGKLRARFSVTFLAPEALTRRAGCVGSVKLVLKIPKVKGSVKRSGKLGWTSNGCAAIVTARLPKKAKGMRAKSTATFSGNHAAAPVTITKKIKVR